MKYFLTIAAFAGLFATTSAQTSASTTSTSATELKEHVCAADCTQETHAYLHGEKGHNCTEACKSTATSEKKAGGCCTHKNEGASCAKAKAGEAHADAGKEHICATACKGDAHAYAHGEKGHGCTAECAHAH